ncbi:MAG TPA: DUF5916 domain-containing protein [Gemmatimonadaceae bacterium]|nr:DUF5916 domain-containing protein [Gemmatimonadaceae bacterium]
MTRLRISALAALAALAPVLACVAPGSLAAQTQSGASRAEPSETSSVAATISAVRTSTPPIIDGRDDDAIWRRAPTISGFTQWMPTEGQRPRFRTEAKVAYDAANLYVFVRAFDARPDSIIRILERRDTFTPSDMIWLFVDSYHDRRSGYEFAVNAAGTKIDQAVYDGGVEDPAWDAVWDVATAIDSLGWTAEFRIPLSQLRFEHTDQRAFGFAIDRQIYRYNERVRWPSYSLSQPDLLSQLGTLAGIDSVDAPGMFELTPYAVSKRASSIANNHFTNPSTASIGGDLRYHLASNVILDATVHPDFGQVEADPAVLNLTTNESFFDERRPFFVAGRGIFRFDVNCSHVSCFKEGLYYSRRIGRAPQLAGAYGDTVLTAPTTILGAAKLTGRTAGNLAVGVFDAVTDRAASSGDTTFEPRTNFSVVRLTQDLRGGNTSLGGIVTAVNRATDRWSAPFLTSDAYTGGLDFRHRFAANAYEVSGSLDASRIHGSRAAIVRVQTDPVHYFQRPDGALAVDSTRTMLDGDAEELRFAKVGGQRLQYETFYQRRSPGFEINDVGFLRRADEQAWNNVVSVTDHHERSVYRDLTWTTSWWQHWTAEGLPTEASFSTNATALFRNNWNVRGGFGLGELGATYDDRSARGGPALRQSSTIWPFASVATDDRRSLVAALSAGANSAFGGHAADWYATPELDYKAGGRFSSALSLSWNHNINDAQWYGLFNDAGGAHYAFTHLDQTTTSATLRANYTMTPAMSLQAYLQPFISTGVYSNVRQLSATPRAGAYDDRFAPFDNAAAVSHPGGFDVKQLQSNLVFRWEYKPASTLFVVWNEGRSGSIDSNGGLRLGDDLRNLFALHPANTVLVKVSYWLTD